MRLASTPTGAPVPGFTNRRSAPAPVFFPTTVPIQPRRAFLSFLGCNDLTRPSPDATDGCATPNSTVFPFRQSKDIKLFSAYVQDQITWHNVGINLGLRNDYL